MRYILHFLLATLLLLAALPLHAQETAESSWCVSAWYSALGDATGLASIEQNLDILDEVNPFWYNPADDGSLLKATIAEDPEQLTLWREAGVKILPTIVTFGFSTMIEDPALRERHIHEIVSLVDTMNYDGIDIDYESFLLHTRDPFSEFIEALSAALHKDGKLLSVTVHAKTSDEGSWGGAAAQDWERLTAAADIFKIMVYDYHNQAGEPGPIAPPAWAEDVLAYAASVTDLSKVRLGLPFYGYSWQRRNPPEAVTWVSVQRTIDNFNLEVVRDPADMEIRLDFDPPALPAQVIYLPDATALAYKLERVQAKFPDLGGVSIWGIGGEDPANWDLLRDLGTCDLNTTSATPDEPAVLFDDFSYVDQAALSANGWIVRTAPGWPGIPGATWDAAGVSLVDAEEPGNRLVQMISTSDGTTVTQTQLCQQRKFYEGTYATRVRFADAPISGTDGDQIVQTFYAISPLARDLDPDYSELDFEYLPNGGWGFDQNVLFATTWETFRPEPNWLADNTSAFDTVSYEGWHTLVMQVADGAVTYYVDGTVLGTHADRYYPEVPMSINYNLWFIRDGQIDSSELREYREQIDWVYYAADTILSPAEVETQVATLRAEAVNFIDTVPASMLESPCNF